MTATTPVLTEEFKDKERVYAKDQTEYLPLPVLKNPDGVLLSRWKLSESERQAIAAGADIFLYNWTFNQPLQPVRIEVGECDRTTAEVAAWMGLSNEPLLVSVYPKL